MTKRRLYIDTYLLVMGRIKELFKTLKINKHKFSKELGISVQQLAKYERGVNSLSIGRLVDIARLLNVDINYLLQDLGFPEQELKPIYRDELMTAYNKIESKECKKALKNIIINLSTDSIRGNNA